MHLNIPNVPEKQSQKLQQIIDMIAVGDDFAPQFEKTETIVDDAIAAGLAKELCNFQHHCRKTGMPIENETVSSDNLRNLLSIHNPEKVKTAIQLQMLHRIHPVILFTDTDSLTKLQTQHPYVYTAFCAVQIIECYTPAKTTEEQWKLHQLRIEFWENLQKLPEPLVIRASEQFKRYLSWVTTKINQMYLKWDTTNLVELSADEDSFRIFIAEVTNNLAKMINSQLSRKHLFEAVTYADLMGIKRKLHGNSAIRGQLLTESKTEEDVFQDEIDKIFRENKLDTDLNLRKVKKKKEKVYKIDLSKMNFDEFIDASPEIRRQREELFPSTADNIQRLTDDAKKAQGFRFLSEGSDKPLNLTNSINNVASSLQSLFPVTGKTEK